MDGGAGGPCNVQYLLEDHLCVKLLIFPPSWNLQILSTRKFLLTNLGAELFWSP